MPAHHEQPVRLGDRECSTHCGGQRPPARRGDKHQAERERHRGRGMAAGPGVLQRRERGRVSGARNGRERLEQLGRQRRAGQHHPHHERAARSVTGQRDAHEHQAQHGTGNGVCQMSGSVRQRLDAGVAQTREATEHGAVQPGPGFRMEGKEPHDRRSEHAPERRNQRRGRTSEHATRLLRARPWGGAQPGAFAISPGTRPCARREAPRTRPSACARAGTSGTGRRTDRVPSPCRCGRRFRSRARRR